MPLARRRLRAMVGELLADATDPALRRHLAGLRAEGFGVNVNLLGEAVLGHTEAARSRPRRRAGAHGPPRRGLRLGQGVVGLPQLNLWAYADTLRRTKAALRDILGAANTTPPVFVNLDMEEYKDLALTLDAFTGLLDEPEFLRLEAGIVLQAYLPESMTALQRLCAWAMDRRRRGGAGSRCGSSRAPTWPPNGSRRHCAGGRWRPTAPRPGPTPTTRPCWTTCCGPSTPTPSRSGSPVTICSIWPGATCWPRNAA